VVQVAVEDLAAVVCPIPVAQVIYMQALKKHFILQQEHKVILVVQGFAQSQLQPADMVVGAAEQDKKVRKP
jgi:hypothetical protein